MIGQHNPLTNHCLQTIFAILILHTAAISCAPLPERTTRETCNHRTFRYDVIVDEGSSFMQDEIIPSVYPQYNDQEVDTCTAPNLTKAVCPLFEEYSRLSVTLENLSENDSLHTNLSLPVTLENLPENDSLHTNLSLLVLVTRKVLIDFCKLKIKEASCSDHEEQQCSLSSISKNCLYSHSAEELINKFNDSRLDLRRGDQYSTAYWIEQLISEGVPDKNVVNTLFNVFENSGYSCTLVENSTCVECNYIFE